ncbi:type VII secretion protein EccCa [Micrococcus luteus]
MSTRIVHRPARTVEPAQLRSEHVIEGAPVLDQSEGRVNLIMLVPLLGAAASMTVMMLFRGSPLAAVGALMMIVTVLASVVLLFSQRGKNRRERQLKREAYLDHLDDLRRRFKAEDARLRAEARRIDPDVDLLGTLVENPHRLWERRRDDPDTLLLRLGIGDLPVRDITVQTETSATDPPDHFLTQEAEAVRERYSVCTRLPAAFALDSLGEVSVLGPAEARAELARGILARAAVAHSPEDLYLALVVPEGDVAAWEWAVQLPHLADQTRPTAVGPLRRVFHTRAELTADLRAELTRRARLVAEARKNATGASQDPRMLLPRLLVLDLTDAGPVTAVPSPDVTASVADLGVTVLRFLKDQVEEPDRIALRLTLRPAEQTGGWRLDAEPQTRRGQAWRVPVDVDPVSAAQAAAVARRLAPLRLSPDSLEHEESVSTNRYTDLLGLHELSPAEIRENWRDRADQEFLRVPLGVDDDGAPVLLDLKESAQLGMGPHGLCVGATGSGKSELLRTLVLALLVTHPPERLNMVLVDFKGGATFAPFEGVPHVSGIITNLSDETSLITRVHESLAGEIRRRQEVLQRAGNISNVTDYELHRREAAARGEDWEPLPHLLVIIDEFGELLTAQPDFIDLFLSIGRIGRSIGVHLLLSSQRIEGGKLRGLDTYLSYRLGLRTLSEAESRTVLDTPDAFHLPAVPGYGYLKVDTSVYDRFKAGYVSGPLSALFEDELAAPLAEQRFDPVVRPFSQQEQRELVAARADERRRRSESAPVPAVRTTGTTVMSHLVDVLRTHERATEPIWLPPLPDALPLDAVTGPPQITTEGPVLPQGGGLRIPLGMVDDPSRQWQGPWSLDLAAGSGNAVFVGGPQTGKSTALRTLALSAALTHSPRELALYGIDLLGSGLRPLLELPHVGGVGIRTERERVRRTVEEVHAMLAEREDVFERHGLDSLQAMRTAHAAGDLPELPVADVVLLVDGYGQLADEFEPLAADVQDILARGSGYGVHVVATATRWNEVRISQQAFFSHRIEFRLGEPAESSHGKRKGESLPVGRPGRALTPDGLVGHLALPRVDGAVDAASATAALTETVRAVAASADGSMVPPVRVLPGLLRPGELAPVHEPGRFALGRTEKDFTTRTVDLFGRDRHLLVLGDQASGRSSLLRHVCRSLVANSTPEDLVIALYDPRQEFDGVVPDDFLGGHARSSLLGQRLSASIAEELKTRVPQDATATPGPPPSPQIVVVLDDYDVLTAGGGSPLAPLTPYVPMASEIGLHVVLARRVTGAARGLHEPFTAAVRESGAGVLLMDGPRTEGALIDGRRAQRQPPGRGLFTAGGRGWETVQTPYSPPPGEDGALQQDDTPGPSGTPTPARPSGEGPSVPAEERS